MAIHIHIGGPSAGGHSEVNLAVGPAHLGRDTLFFLCYSRQDGHEVGRVYGRLRAEFGQHAAFMDDEAAPGQRWQDALDAGMVSAACLLCWVTPAFLTSPHTMREVGFAQGRGRLVLPVFVGRGAFERAPSFLTQLQGWCVEREDAVEQLVAALIAARTTTG